MAKICTEQKLEETRLTYPLDPYDEEEEEALSLCDLPVNLSTRDVDGFRSRGDESFRIGEESHEASTKVEQEESEFDFRFDDVAGSSSWVGSEPAEQAHMSTADELFFKGRILPLRHSVSLDAGSTRDPSQFLSRSESDKFRRVNSFASGGTSRSSSCRSYYSITGVGGTDQKIKNSFINYSQPSPQPQIRRTSSLTARISTSRNSKLSIWDFFRLGLVRAPEIELQDLKFRSITATNSGNTKLPVSRNSSCSSTSTSCNSKKTTGESKMRRQRKASTLSYEKRVSLFGDCKCSVAAGEAVPRKKSAPGRGGIVNTTAGEEKQRRRKITEATTTTAKKKEKAEKV